MNNVIYVKFPNQSKRKLPRQRVFYIGQYYAGPPLCQSLEKLWLKRKPNNRWVFQQKYYGRVCEWEEYDGDDLLDVWRAFLWLMRLPLMTCLEWDGTIGVR